MIRNQFDLHFFVECEAAVTKIIIIIIIDDDITVYIIINVRRETFSGSFVPNFTLLSFSKLQNIASPFSIFFNDGMARVKPKTFLYTSSSSSSSSC